MLCNLFSYRDIFRWHKWEYHRQKMLKITLNEITIQFSSQYLQNSKNSLGSIDIYVNSLNIVRIKKTKCLWLIFKNSFLMLSWKVILPSCRWYLTLNIWLWWNQKVRIQVLEHLHIRNTLNEYLLLWIMFITTRNVWIYYMPIVNTLFKWNR
jgi:hypothetical protein